MIKKSSCVNVLLNPFLSFESCFCDLTCLDQSEASGGGGCWGATLCPFSFDFCCAKAMHLKNRTVKKKTVTRHTTKWSWCWCLVYLYHHNIIHPDIWYSCVIPIVSHVENCLAIISSAFERGSFGLLRRFRSQNSNLILSHIFTTKNDLQLVAIPGSLTPSALPCPSLRSLEEFAPLEHRRKENWH